MAAGLKITLATLKGITMKKYYSCYNNGVTAIVSEEVLHDIEKFNKIYHLFIEQEKGKPYTDERKLAHVASEGVRHLATPVFTFARTERVAESPWFTGDTEVLDRLRSYIRYTGGTIESEGFHVPFSNGMEYGMHGHEAMTHELSYVTTEQQFREAFGISIAQLKEVIEYGSYASRLLDQS